MAQWRLEDIPWHQFDSSKVTPQMLSMAKAACMVEHNGQDYARYLCEVFHDDPEFQELARGWAEEEVQHGKALRRWVELADSGFDFDKSFNILITGYKLPMGVDASVRGSRSGELLARCVVEVGTSAYYTALKDASGEPVFRAICAKIAADEFRHYKLFYTHLQRYLGKENIGLFRRMGVALRRVMESEDDELAYAYYAAHEKSGAPYSRKRYTGLYLLCVYPAYRRHHIERMVGMALKAVGLNPQGGLHRLSSALAWRLLQWRAAAMRRDLG